MDTRTLLTLLISLSLVVPAAAAQNETTAEPSGDDTEQDCPSENETTDCDDGDTQEQDDGTSESTDIEDENDSYEGDTSDDEPPEEECYETDDGDWVCEENHPEDENDSYEGDTSDDEPPEEECYETEDGDWVCEDDYPEDEASYEEDPPEEECYETDDGDWVCEDDYPEDDARDDECYETRDGDWVCEDDHTTEDDRYDERPPPPPLEECFRDPETGEEHCPPSPEDEYRPREAHHPEPPEDAPCQPHPDRDDAMICKPPEQCRGRIGETRACTPPPECSPNGDGTFTCTMPEGGPEHRPRHSAAEHGPEPDCRPSEDDPRAIVCEPPEECRGEIGQTPMCTPPPECSPNGDGTFTCRFEGAPPARGSPDDHRRAPPPDDRRPSRDSRDRLDDSARAQAREQVHQAVVDAMSGFRADIQDLRSQYQDGKDQLNQRYEEGKTELRTAYEACLDGISEEGDRASQIREETACRRDAREGLRDLRNELLAERDLLREKLLGQAEDLHFRTCSTLEERVNGILVDQNLYDVRLRDLVDAQEVGACTSMLLEMGGQGTSRASGWLHSTEGDT